MAGDWVKMRTDLYRDPKVCLIANELLRENEQLAEHIYQMTQSPMNVTRNVLRNVTVGALVTVWGVTRHRGKRDGDDLVVRDAALGVIDDIADLPGFGAAMAVVGWVRSEDKGLVFPNFFADFNVEPSADERKKNADRQRRFREKRNGERNALRNVTVTSQSNTEESRVEESRESPSSPTPSQNKGGGGGLSEMNGAGNPEWAKVTARLARCGVNDARDAVRLAHANGMTTDEAHAIVDMFERCKPRWKVGGLHSRFVRHVPGQRIEDGWPPSQPGTDKRAVERSHVNGQAAAVIKAGRKAGKTDEAITADLQAAGLQWP